LKYSRRLIQLPLLAVLVLFAVAASARAQLVTRFEVSPAVISPNGDGRQDETRVRYAIADTSLGLSLVVFAADSVTPVDTLRAPAPDNAPGSNRDYYWAGTRWDGAPAAEGAYVVTLRATDQNGILTVSNLPVFVDVTPPVVQILSVIPDPYAPGLSAARPALEVSFLVGSTSPIEPGRSPDALGVTIADPAGKKVDGGVITTAPAFAGSSGNYVTSWDATELAATLAGGEYSVTVSIDDAAGFTAQSVYHFVIDANSPVVRITSPVVARVRVVPDSLHGWAYDANGIDSLSVRYPSSAYLPVAGTHLRNDTLIFAVPVADSVQTEGEYPFRIRAVDRAGRSHAQTFTLIYDTTAPGTPVLQSFSGTWRQDRFPLAGSADNGGDVASFIRISRNGAVLDSLPLTTPGGFSIDVPLVPGSNAFVAYQRDGAGNVSGPSNIVTVMFQSSGGLYFPVPFTPGASFQVNAPRAASSVTLRVFDVKGDLVTLFENDSPRQFYTFPWNGKNSSDHGVRRGPLVAIAAIAYDDGTRDIYREVFLFDPNP
jgi:hypothetical protein